MSKDSNDDFYTIDDIISQCENSCERNGVNKISSIAIIPPFESPDADTDEDSDFSDDETEGNLEHLPRRILRSAAVASFDQDEENEPEKKAPPKDSREQTSDVEMEIETSPRASTSQDPPKKKTKMSKIKSSPAIWSKDKKRNFILANRVPQHGPATIDFLKHTISSPYDAFKMFFSDQLIEHIVTQTNLYAGQKGNHNLNVTFDEVNVVLGVMLLSGYHRLPSKRMYWQGEPDCKVPIVAEAIRRRRFEDILRYLHLNDNSWVNKDDRYYKIRPLFDSINHAFKLLCPEESVCVDESIIPYYGRHPTKQFIRGKPIRFGFKLWVMAAPSGYILHAEPYCGAHTRLPDTGLGQGGDVVIGLIEHANLPTGSKLYFDNLFTSVSLLEELSKRGLGGTGTLRENRIGRNMELPDKNIFKKSSRGESFTVCNGTLTATRWNDNAVVTVLSNCDSEEPMKTVSRYNRAERKKIQVKMPNMIAQYNANMGGVDLNDQFTAQYRTKIRIKKWWWPLFAWGVDVCCVQGWLLYRRLGNQISLLQFKRQVVLQVLNRFGTPSSKPGPSMSYSHSAALDDIRRDLKGHVIVKGQSKYRRCKQCSKRTTYLCVKCNVPLHPDCFQYFHV